MREKVSASGHLSQKFNKYVEYRREVERSSKAFSEKMQEQQASHGVHRQHAPHGHRPQLATPKEISVPQAKRLARYAPLIEQSAARHKIPVELICGVMLQESNCNEKAVSKAGAQGLMQLMPQTAERFGVRNSFDPAQNIEGGTKYLKILLDRFNGDLKLTLAAYNAGEGAVERHGNKIPPFRETQDYVPKVLGYMQSMVDIFTPEKLPNYARRV